MSQTKAQLIDNLVQPITGALGSASAPTFSFTADPNTGIYSPGADQLAISTGGSGRLFVDASGNVGIGNNAPILAPGYTALRVNGSTGGLLELTSSGSRVLQIQSDGVSAGAQITTITSSPLIFNTNGAERFRITSAGLVGIGTSSPTAPLHVVSTSAGYTTSMLAIGEQSASTGRQLFLGMHTTDGKGYIQSVHWGTAYKELLLNPNGGNVGIGTSAPVADLQVNKSSDVTIALSNSNSVTSGNRGQLAFYNSASSTVGQIRFGAVTDNVGTEIQFHTRPAAGSLTQSMTLDSSGRLGIGTSNLHGALDVKAATGVDTKLSISDGFTSGNLRLTTCTEAFSAYKNLEISTLNTLFLTSGAERMRIDSAGRVGIGTSGPSSALEVNGNIRTYTAAAGDVSITHSGLVSSITAAGSISLAFGANNSERARIDTSGRLLVGTSSSPSSGNGQYSRLVIQGYVGGNASAGIMSLQRGVTASSITTGEGIGEISFNDSSGSTFSKISCEADANGGAGDYPGRLVFSTTADGASSPTERMRIGSTGSLLCGRDFRDATNGTDDQFIIGGNGYSAFHGLNTTAYTIGQNSNSRALRIGSGSGWATSGVSLAAGGTSWGTYSDERLKTDIVELTGCLESIKGIRCVSYRLTDLDEADSKKRLGVIAQDLVGKYDEAITASQRAPEDEIEYLSVQYTDLIPVLLKALQEATTEIETLKTKVAALESA